MKHLFRVVVLAVILLAVMVLPVSAGWEAQAVEPPAELDMAIFGYLGIILALAFLTETLVEFLFSDLFLQFPKLEPYAWTQKYIAVIVGIGGAFIYQFDLLYLLADFFGVPLVHSAFGIVMTGIGIGKGSNYLHDFIMRFFRGKLSGLEREQYAKEMIDTWVQAAEQVTTAEGAGPVKKLWVEQRAEEAGLGLSNEAVDTMIEASVYRMKS
jgi:hypothetical protein